jgi:isoleucyl-tRNA synthetase
MTEATIAHVQSVVSEKGTDAWWQLPLEDLLPAELRDQAPRLKKGEDTMVGGVPQGCPTLMLDMS